MEALLICSDGVVQVIGQPKSLAHFLPFLQSLVAEITERSKKERLEALNDYTEDELQNALSQRSNPQDSE